ncbi:MAG: hypothetical protein JF599_00595 [Verrucomicrobia bacterium]|nr:hypothetical protein [Verrucomicrobiota bacterium]
MRWPRRQARPAKPRPSGTTRLLFYLQEREYRSGVAIDFRSDPSPSPEGRGRARRAWDAYAKAVNSVTLPVLEPAIRRLATSMSVDMVGFWVAWHLHGGFEGLVELGMHPSTVWRKVKRFRVVTGQHPDDFELPGVKLDREAYWNWARESNGTWVKVR